MHDHGNTDSRQPQDVLEAQLLSRRYIGPYVNELKDGKVINVVIGLGGYPYENAHRSRQH